MLVAPSGPDSVVGQTNVNDGTSASFTCSVTNGYPLPTILWTKVKDGSEVNAATSEVSTTPTTNGDGTYSIISTLTFTPVAADNGTNLKCAMSHSKTLTNKEAVSAYLIVTSKSRSHIFLSDISQGRTNS